MWLDQFVADERAQAVVGERMGGTESLHVVDVAFGLALVAYSEELIFRRCSRHLFKMYLNDGRALVVVTSLLFGAYHRWTALGISSKLYW